MSSKTSQRKRAKKSLSRRIIGQPYQTCLKAIRYLTTRHEQAQEQVGVDLNPKLVDLLSALKEEVLSYKQKITESFTRTPARIPTKK